MTNYQLSLSPSVEQQQSNITTLHLSSLTTCNFQAQINSSSFTFKFSRSIKEQVYLYNVKSFKDSYECYVFILVLLGLCWIWFQHNDKTLCPGTSVPGTADFMVKLSTPDLLRESSIFCLWSSAAGCWMRCSSATCRSSASLRHKYHTHHPMGSIIIDYQSVVQGGGIIFT